MEFMGSSKWQEFFIRLFFVSSCTKNFPRIISCFRLIHDDVMVFLREFSKLYTTHCYKHHVKNRVRYILVIVYCKALKNYLFLTNLQVVYLCIYACVVLLFIYMYSMFDGSSGRKAEGSG
jgi:hypothetical protein